MKNERALSRKRAYECEHAIEKRCRCRCAGKFHGAARVAPADLDQLPADDPHYIAPEEEHQLGPMRKVKSRLRRSTRWPYREGKDVKHGVWILTLVCGHIRRLKLSRRPPKEMHCLECKDPARICEKCGRPHLEHSKMANHRMIVWQCPVAHNEKKAARPGQLTRPSTSAASGNGRKRPLRSHSISRTRRTAR